LRKASASCFMRRCMRTRATTCAARGGLVMKSEAPRARPATSCSSSSWLLMKMMGTSISSGISFIAAQTSKPLMPGISMSSRIRSGTDWRAMRSASCPEVAKRSRPNSCRMVPSTPMTVGSSSTSRMLKVSCMNPDPPELPWPKGGAGSHHQRGRPWPSRCYRRAGPLLERGLTQNGADCAGRLASKYAPAVARPAGNPATASSRSPRSFPVDPTHSRAAG
jgi:hypothetical protein